MERERLETEKTHVYWLRNRDIWNKSELRRRLGLGFGSYRGASASSSELWSSTSVEVSWWRRVITVLTSFWRSSESASTSERAAAAQYGWARSSSPSMRHAATMTSAEPQSASGAGALSVAAIGADGHLVYSSSQQSTSVVHIERRSRIRRAAAACCCWPLWLLPLLALALALLGGGLLPAETTSGMLSSYSLRIRHAHVTLCVPIVGMRNYLWRRDFLFLFPSESDLKPGASGLSAEQVELLLQRLRSDLQAALQEAIETKMATLRHARYHLYISHTVCVLYGER